MLAALFLGISRCASAELCPDDQALIAAVRRRDNEAVAAASARFAQENPDNLSLVHSERIKGVSDVVCGKALPGDLPTISCKFTIRYWSYNAHLVTRLVKKGGIWEIDEAKVVTRKR